jgi:2-polyprenyl-6-hydroxyphenyl methylase/3-demethylubiquinone-9 3-methyltransferase
VLDSRTEIRAGQRFAFGANWQSFIQLVDQERIAVAISSLTQALGVDDLSGKTLS